VVLPLGELLPAPSVAVRCYDPWENRWQDVRLNADRTLAVPNFKRSLVVVISAAGG
jgi:hypothetical protein